MVLYFLCENLSKIFLGSKFETNRPPIKLTITFCAIWHYRDLRLKGLRHGNFKVTSLLRGCPSGKNRTRASFNKSPTNYISETKLNECTLRKIIQF